MNYVFITSCVEANGDDINEMTAAAQQITRRTFRRYVNREELKAMEKQLGYTRTMAADWHVSYWKSQYKGQPCVYFDWSCIEHVFTEGV